MAAPAPGDLRIIATPVELGNRSRSMSSICLRSGTMKAAPMMPPPMQASVTSQKSASLTLRV